MEIILSNFRCYKNRTFTIPYGVTLIDGQSGKGKTTLLQSIKYVLYGNVKQITSYGEKKTKVELTYRDMKIIRSSNPCRLLLYTKDNVLYEDDAAQEMINNIFGIQFELTSYMLQKGVCQFLNLSNNEKLQLLEKLSVTNEEKIQEIKEKIKHDEKEIKQLYVSVQSQIQLLETQLTKKPIFNNHYRVKKVCELKDILSLSGKIQDNWKKIKEEYDYKIQEIKELVKKQNVIKKEYEQTKKELDILYHDNELINNELLLLKEPSETIDKDKELIHLHECYKEYTMVEKEYQSTLQIYNDFVKKEKEEHQLQMEDLQKQVIIVDTNRITILKKEKEKMLCDIELWNKINKLRTDLEQEKVKECKSKMEATANQLNKMQTFLSDIDSRRFIQMCPECKHSLSISGNMIKSADSQPITEQEKKKEEEYKTKLPLFKKQHEQLYRLVVTSEEWKRELELIKEPLLDEKELKNKMIEHTEEMTTYENMLHTNRIVEKQIKEKKLYNPESKYKTLEQTLQKLKQQLDKLDKGVECKDIQVIMDRISLEEKNNEKRIQLYKKQQLIKKNIDKLDVIDYQEIDYQSTLDKLNGEYQLILEHVQKSNTSYIKATEQYHQGVIYAEFMKKNKDIHEKKKQLIMYQTKLENLDTLYQHIIHTESICLEKFIVQLNHNIKWYLEQFFPDFSIKMEICSEKETKTNNKIKNEINVKVLYRDELIDLKQLSGGEYDRCALAFLLTINELSHSPCLFLDESISSLDLTLSEQILDVIREKQNKNIVLIISHQANTGFFDHVIHI